MIPSSSSLPTDLFGYNQLGPSRYAERFGLDFEQFATGQRFQHRPGITLSQQDNVDEALETLNSAMVHYDSAYAQRTSFTRPLMVSTITVQRLFGLGWKTFARRSRISSIESIALTSPLYGGDTIYAESEILDKTADSSRDGSMRVALRGYKPDGTRVAEIVYACTVWRSGHGRHAAGASARAVEPRFASYRVLPDGAFMEQTGLFFEDFVPGESFVHAPSRSVLREESITHAFRSFEWNPIYHEVGAGQEPTVMQTWVLAMVTPLTTRTFGRVTANLAWKDVEFGADVYVGDTLSAESQVLDKRESKSRPNEGVLTVSTRAVNQRGEEVLRYQRALLVYRRDGEHPYAAANY